MWVVHFFSPADRNTVCHVEGPFDSHDLALDYIDQRDHLLDFTARAVPLSPARFVPDQSYRDAA